MASSINSGGRSEKTAVKTPTVSKSLGYYTAVAFKSEHQQDTNLFPTSKNIMAPHKLSDLLQSFMERTPLPDM